MTNHWIDIQHSDCILIQGSNAAENHPISFKWVMKAKDRGAKVIHVDPRFTRTSARADFYTALRSGTDIAFFGGMIKYILDNEKFFKDYVVNYTNAPFLVSDNFDFNDGLFSGYDPTARKYDKATWTIKKDDKGLAEKDPTLQNPRCVFQLLKKHYSRYDLEKVSAITGTSVEDLKTVYELYSATGVPDKAGTIMYALGQTQHTTGVDNVKALANLAMVTGNVGKENAGVNPLRGQNNVQGACDMGALPNVLPGYQPVTDENARKKFEAVWGVTLDSKVGLTIMEMMSGAIEGKVKAMFILGEDPLISDPNVSHVKEAIENLDFLVVQDLFLTEVAKHADVILPGVSFAEKEGTFTNTERRVQRGREAIKPRGSARPDWKIFLELFKRMGAKQSCTTPEKIMKEIAGVTPQYGGITYKRIEREGILWPCPDKNHPGTKYLHKDRFTRGKGLFFPIEFIDPNELPDAEYPHILTTGRVLYHWHGGNMSRRSKGLMAIYPEGLVEMNPQDAEAVGCKEGDMVSVESRRGKVIGKLKVTKKSPPGVIFMTFHFPDVLTNLLTNDALDPIAKIPEYKVCAVKVQKAS